MSGHFEHERERLHSLVDKFIDHVEEKYEPDDEPRIDVAAICAIVEWTDEDGTYGVPTWYCESQRPPYQMALFESCYLRIAGRIMNMSDSDDMPHDS